MNKSGSMKLMEINKLRHRIIIRPIIIEKHPNYKEIKDALLDCTITPITVQNNVILDGEYRVAIAKSLGLTTIPAYEK